jgi:hypothetical protein
MFHTHTTRPIAVRNLLRASSESPWIVPRAVPCIYSMQETMKTRNRSNREKNDDTREIVLQLHGGNTTHPEKLKKISCMEAFPFTRTGVLSLCGIADGHPTWTRAWTRMSRAVPLFWIFSDQLHMQTEKLSPPSMAVYLNSGAKREKLGYESVHVLHDKSVITVCFAALTLDSERQWHPLFTVTYRYINQFLIAHTLKLGEKTPREEEDSKKGWRVRWVEQL